MSTFTGFSEEELRRIKSGEIASPIETVNSKPKLIHPTSKKKVYQYKSIDLLNQKIDDAIDNIQFDKCRLSLKPTLDNNNEKANGAINITENTRKHESIEIVKNESNEIKNVSTNENTENEVLNNNVEHDNSSNKNSSVEVHDTMRVVDYAEDDLASHRAKLEELQLKQRLMEEQNKKRKEMLAKALDDRTRQTEEEVMKLEKIKKELHILDGQFSQDVAVLRKKIDLACLTYSEAEKHYLKVEKEFLQAKIHLQKEKEKKELLTEHLCALITHNETRKAQKLETLMLELATKTVKTEAKAEPIEDERDDSSVIVDGVDQRTGKIVAFNGDS